ncbi:MAG: YibE/F family protein [Candidatus Margulisbacteria bacterium]|nr:YibE/F family protein [Candidatus Margulisiibacteriota bacterium]
MRFRFYLLLSLFALIIFLPNWGEASEGELEHLPKPQYAKAEVFEVETYDLGGHKDSPIKEISQQVTLKILSGKFKVKVVAVDHIASGMMGGEMILKPGNRVILFVDENPPPAESPDGSPLFNVADYVRDTPIYWLAFFFALLLVIIGGMKGVKALVSLVITICLIFFILFPLTLWGFNPLLVSVLIAGAVSLIVFRIVGGKSIKSVAAAIGTLLGVAIAGILAFVVGNMIHLTGMSSEESRILLYSMDLKINYQGLLFGSILIGALGAIMDVGMSIASSIDEVRKVHPEANLQNLFNAGMNVGRDVMGTMSNTLILAYTGSTLPLLLLLIANNMSFSKILNMEMIAVEAVRALAGSIGLVLCIPITALISAFLYSRPKIKTIIPSSDWLLDKGRAKDDNFSC